LSPSDRVGRPGPPERPSDPAGSDRELDGRVAIVTGGAGGIGRAIATVLSAGGANVVVADRDDDGAHAVAADLPAAEAHVIDLADAAACRAMVDEVIGHHARLDILVNAAGFQHIAPVVGFPLDRWDSILRTMLTAPFILTQAALPAMIEGGWGRIVNIGSIHSVVASPNKVAYVAAKHGLLGLTRAVAVEVGAHGITCNAVCPAYVRTPLVEAQIADQARTTGVPERDVVDTIMLADAAIPRLLEASEVAAYVRFLCSDAAAGITGSAQLIDGGWTAH
jgi:3-hydroxybutyrate dehydrogenase